MATAFAKSEARPIKRQATYADLQAVPEPFVAEILNGDLFTQPRPRSHHAAASSALGAELGDAFQRGRSGPGGWIILDEPELHLGDDVVVPDLAAWRRTRLAGIADVAYIEIAPDWVCEVLSASTETRDRIEKRDIYARAGVEHYWMVDTRAELLETFALVRGDWVVGPAFKSGSDVCAPPFEAISFPLDILWPLKTAAETQKDDE